MCCNKLVKLALSYSTHLTHRLDLIRHFDHILVMQNGKIMEEGNHDTLMEKNGIYASLWKKETERKSK